MAHPAVTIKMVVGYIDRITIRFTCHFGLVFTDLLLGYCVFDKNIFTPVCSRNNSNLNKILYDFVSASDIRLFMLTNKLLKFLCVG